MANFSEGPAGIDQFRVVVESAPNGIIVVDRTGHITLVNAQIESLFGYSRGELIGKSVEILVPDRLRRGHAVLRSTFSEKPETRRMGAGRDLHGCRKDGTEFPIEIGLNAISDPAGGGDFILATVVDITERKMAELRIAEQQKRLLLVVESAPNGVLTINSHGQITLVNAQIEKLFGYSREELIGQPVELLVPRRWRGSHAGLRTAFSRNPETRPMGAGRELYGLRKDGTEFPVEIGLNAIAQGGGSDDLILATVVDITERKQAAERQELLVKEVLHRTKNLLAVVQSIALRSLAGDRPLAEAKQVFLDRLLALSRTDTVLTEGSLEGAPLLGIVRQELASFSDRADIGGSDVFLKPNAAQNFALLVHELATNAVKHGSLSRPTGSISVVCRVVNSRTPELSFEWAESGGPTIKEPARPGFGLKLLDGISKTLGGSSALQFESVGLKFNLHAPLDNLSARQHVGLERRLNG